MLRHLNASAPSASLLCLLALLLPASLASATAPRTPARFDADSGRIALELRAILVSTGELREAGAGYRGSPVGGGDLLACRLALAEALSVQRAEFRRILAAAEALPAIHDAFRRRIALLDLLDDIVRFQASNLRLLRLGKSRSPPPGLAAAEERMASCMRELTSLVGEVDRSLRASF